MWYFACVGLVKINLLSLNLSRFVLGRRAKRTCLPAVDLPACTLIITFRYSQVHWFFAVSLEFPQHFRLVSFLVAAITYWWHHVWWHGVAPKCGDPHGSSGVDSPRNRRDYLAACACKRQLYGCHCSWSSACSDWTVRDDPCISGGVRSTRTKSTNPQWHRSPKDDPQRLYQRSFNRI